MPLNPDYVIDPPLVVNFTINPISMLFFEHRGPLALWCYWNLAFREKQFVTPDLEKSILPNTYSVDCRRKLV